MSVLDDRETLIDLLTVVVVVGFFITGFLLLMDNYEHGYLKKPLYSSDCQVVEEIPLGRGQHDRRLFYIYECTDGDRFIGSTRH